MQGAQGIELKPFRTVSHNAEIEQVIHKSRFIGRCYAVSDEAEAMGLLEAVRKRHWDATHNCYAFRIGAGGMLSRSSDDGEPSGTAGAPILQTLTRMELTNALCVVTRYFGGVLLGAGGLIRAYAGAAAEACKEAGVVEMRPCARLDATFQYADWAAAENTVRMLAEVEHVSYADVVTATLWTPRAQAEAVAAKLVDVTGGRARVMQTGYELRAAACT